MGLFFKKDRRVRVIPGLLSRKIGDLAALLAGAHACLICDDAGRKYVDPIAGMVTPIPEVVSGATVIAVGGESCEANAAEEVAKARAAGMAVGYVRIVTDFAAALAVPARAAVPDLTLCDPDLFGDEGESYRLAIARALRIGVVFDRWVFREVFSSFSKASLLSRVLPLLLDVAGSERARAYLSFGETAGCVYRELEKTLTPAEVLAVGMLAECRASARAGILRTDLFTDLDGALTYYGFPRAVAAESAEFRAAFLAAHTDPVHIPLPERAGKCILCDLAPERAADLLEETTWTGN